MEGAMKATRLLALGLVGCLFGPVSLLRAEDAKDGAHNDATIGGPAFTEATLRQQWGAIDEQLQLRKVDQEALSHARDWRSGDNAPSPMAGKEGRVVFEYGSTVPRVICAPLRVCDIELHNGEELTEDAMVGDSVQWVVDVAFAGTTPHVVVKPKAAGLMTNMVVYTNRRVYHFELASSKDEHMPFISFSFPDERRARWQAAMQRMRDSSPPTGAPTATESSDYEVRANPGSLFFGYTIEKAGRWLARRRIDWAPTRVWDDGEKTIIEMPRSVLARELPILLVRDGDKQGKVVNLRVKGQHFVVDRLFRDAVLVKGVGRRQERIVIRREED